MTIGVADVMKYFNQGKMQWWGWEDTANGEVYSNLKLLDDTATMPTEDEVNDKIAEIQVQEDRKNAYPTIADQLDSIWHAIEDGDFTNTKMKNTDFYTKLKEVKDDNPKG